MQNFSYYILPLYPYAPPYSPCSQNHPLPLSLAFAGPIASQFLPYPMAANDQINHPVGAQAAHLGGEGAAGVADGGGSSSLVVNR